MANLTTRSHLLPAPGRGMARRAVTARIRMAFDSSQGLSAWRRIERPGTEQQASSEGHSDDEYDQDQQHCYQPTTVQTTHLNFHWRLYAQRAKNEKKISC